MSEVRGAGGVGDRGELKLAVVASLGRRRDGAALVIKCIFGLVG
jgi:hypothetical protein